MRILIVDTLYPAFLRAHYARNPALAGEPYELQWRALMDALFGAFDAYSHHLGELGHPAHELVVNCEPLQRAWAAEHGLQRWWRRRPTTSAIVLAQAAEFAPDVVYVQDLRALAPQDLRLLRQRTRLLVGQIATEPPRDDVLRAFDLIVSPLPSLQEAARKLGVDAAPLRLAFDARVLERVPASDKRHGAVFVGSLHRSPRWEANKVVVGAARRAPIELWGPGAAEWEAAGEPLPRHRGEAWGVDMYRLLGRALVAVNRHGTVAGDLAANMRLFEATGMGALVVTDAKTNLGDLFEPDRELVTYDGEDALVAQVTHHLAHPSEAAAIARSGQERTLREHTYGARMRELAGLLSERLP